MSKCECEKCLHYEVCQFPHQHGFTGECDHYKDKSLFVELPCKAGDTVYWIDKETGKIVSAILQEFRMGFCVMTEYGTRGYIPHTSFDDNMFYTQEQAERKLKEVGE